MDFDAIVGRVRQLLGGTTVGTDEPHGPGVDLLVEIYGRVCNTVATARLSSDPDRKSVFLFGPDAVRSILLQHSAYGILCSIGRDKDYLHYTVC